MTTKYKTSFGSVHPYIKKVKVEKETEKSVWINGRRMLKSSNYENFYDTWEGAFRGLLSYQLKKVEDAEKRLKYLKGKLEEVRSLINEQD